MVGLDSPTSFVEHGGRFGVIPGWPFHEVGEISGHGRNVSFVSSHHRGIVPPLHEAPGKSAVRDCHRDRCRRRDGRRLVGIPAIFAGAVARLVGPAPEARRTGRSRCAPNGSQSFQPSSGRGVPRPIARAAVRVRGTVKERPIPVLNGNQEGAGKALEQRRIGVVVHF
jgi:hypothetical protein